MKRLVELYKRLNLFPIFFSSRLQLLEWVSSEAVTSILHKLIEQRMEQHCRGEYERSFLLEFQEVRRRKPSWGSSPAGPKLQLR